MTSAVTQYTTRLLTPDTWDDFAALVEANNGVWGGCWCIGFHPEGISKDSTAAGNREAKLTHVNNGTIHQMLVYRDGRCVGWCQYGPPAEVARPTPSRWMDVTRNVAPTCIPGQRACSKSSDSSATVASPSGAGSCVCASPPRNSS